MKKFNVRAVVESTFTVSDEAWMRIKDYIPDTGENAQEEQVRFFFEMLCLRGFDVHQLDGFADLPKHKSGKGYGADVWLIEDIIEENV